MLVYHLFKVLLGSFLEFSVNLILKFILAFINNAVCKILYKDCCGVYVDDTGMWFNTCKSEHRRDLKPLNKEKLKENELNKKVALVWHCYKHKHKNDFVNFEIWNFYIGFC